MDVSGLYGFTLTLVLVGMVAGIGVLVLDRLTTSGAVTADANTSIIAARDAVADIPEDWLGLVVTIAILAIVLSLTIAGFAYYKRR